MNDSNYSIISTYGAEYRGFVQYYLLAGDVNRLNRLRWDMERSMLHDPGREAPRHPWAMRGRYRSVDRHPPRQAALLRSQDRAPGPDRHWSRASAESRCGERRTRSSPTGFPHHVVPAES